MSNKDRNVIVLGVTGGIACGKSAAGRILCEMGFAVCDADHVAHELMKKGAPVFEQVVDHFGARILMNDGEISRPLLGEIVFEDPGQRNVLNRLIHPAVREALEQWISEKRRAGRNAAVLIPLLFESGMQDLDWDAILCVSSRIEDVFNRLEKRGFTRDEAKRRVRSQMPLEEKEMLADQVVPNHGTLKELETATRKAVEAIVGER
ncbi:MAG: dephospho-CoA kinase [Verrucomicrobiota bacterium]